MPHDALIPPIVDADWALARAAERPVTFADVRWYLDGRDGRAAYEQRHIPGAVWVDLDRQLAAQGAPPTEGRHPLPDPDDFAAAMSSLGIGDETVVVAYDDTGGMTAARLVVMLRMLGRDAAVLDGGLDAWPGPFEAGSGPRPATAGFTARPWPAECLASADEVGDRAIDGSAVVLDARAAGRFSGEIAVVDRRPGHVPGARNAPWNEALDPETHRFRERDDLARHYAHLGVGPSSDVITYCGSGVSACVNVVAMEHAGLRAARLFVASWSGWSADPARPAELGKP